MTNGARRGEWLGGRDSNPDTMVQSHVSYRWTTSQQDVGTASLSDSARPGNAPHGAFPRCGGPGAGLVGGGVAADV